MLQSDLPPALLTSGKSTAKVLNFLRLSKFYINMSKHKATKFKFLYDYVINQMSDLVK